MQHTLLIDGRTRSFTPAELRREIVRSTQDAMKIDGEYENVHRERTARFVAWGSLLVQARPLIAEGEFCQWIAEGGCKHRQKAYSAIGMATELADANGHLDDEKFQQAIAKYNRECAGRDGFKALPLKSRSIRTAEAALGMRPGPRERAPARPLAAASAGALMIGGREVDEAEMYGLGGGAGRGERVPAAGAGAEVAPPAERMPISIAHGRAGDREVPGSGERVANGDRPGRVGGSLPRRAGGDLPGQLSWDEQFAAAAELARSIALMFDRHDVEPALMAEFRALAERITKGGA